MRALLRCSRLVLYPIYWIFKDFMVAIAQLVEPRIVIPVVVGSNPISHPIFVLCSLRGWRNW
jgi:hypothetical protein